MSTINVMLSWVKHERSFITSGTVLQQTYFQLKVIVDSDEIMQVILVEYHETLKSRVNFPRAVLTVNYKLLILFLHKENVENFHLQYYNIP